MRGVRRKAQGCFRPCKIMEDAFFVVDNQARSYACETGTGACFVNNWSLLSWGAGYAYQANVSNGKRILCFKGDAEACWRE